MLINKKNKKILIVGTGGGSKVVADAIQVNNSYDIVGFIDDFKDVGSVHLGRKVVGSTKQICSLIGEDFKTKVFIAIGDNWLRKKKYDLISSISPNIDFATVIHPSANISQNVKIGKGVYIAAGVSINTYTEIGKFSILNTNSSIDHDSILGDFSSLGPNCSTGGNVNIGNLSAIGIGATILHRISIGDETIIGAGSLLMNDCKNNLVLYGNPAKIIRSRKKDDRYV